MQDADSRLQQEPVMPGKILVVDDDRKTVELVRMYLESEGYFVFPAYDGQEALHIAKKHQPNLIVLDLMLPRVDGMEVCRAIRKQSQVPIIMLTARTTEEDKLLGLNSGADDYIVKPFSPREVLARVKAVLRRASASPEADTNMSGPLSFRNLRVDPARHEATIGEASLTLTPKEFSLLTMFTGNPGRLFSRAELLAGAFGKDYEGLERTVDVHVMNLRKKIEELPEVEVAIQTVYGKGYKLAER